jgi:hypothetical protein
MQGYLGPVFLQEIPARFVFKLDLCEELEELIGYVMKKYTKKLDIGFFQRRYIS